MLGGIIGDVAGSPYEGFRWTDKNHPVWMDGPLPLEHVERLIKNTSFVRAGHGPTDDTLCAMGLLKARLDGTNPAETLAAFCRRHATAMTGFGKSFEAWLSNTKPYGSFGNGALMRLSFLPRLQLPLDGKLALAHRYTAISHDHPDALAAVRDYVLFAEALTITRDIPRSARLVFPDRCFPAVAELRNRSRFEIRADGTLEQAISVLLESRSFDEVLRTSFWLGGDCDTLATVAGSLGELVFPDWRDFSVRTLATLEPFPEFLALLSRFEAVADRPA